jgi:uncharacterized protein YggU (UPF0235/DUF167 family)
MLFVEDLPIKIKDGKLMLFVKVTPKASTNRIGKVFNDHLKIYVTSAAEAGQANKAVIDLLSEALKTNKNSLNIMHGLTDSYKIISLTGDVNTLVKSLQIIVSR